MFKGLKWSKALIGAFFAVVVAYIIFQIAAAFSTGVQTIRAQVETSVVSTGGDAAVFVRKEYPLASGSDNCVVLMENGENISKDETYAVRYASEADIEAYARASALDEKADSLADIRTGGDEYTDLSALNAKLVTLLKNDGDSGLLQKSDDVRQRRSDAEYLMLLREFSIDGREDVDTEISSLRSDAESARAGLGAATPLKVSEPGYYSPVSDGYEAEITPELASAITADELSALIERIGDAPADENSTGKLATDFRWRVMFTISSEYASGLKVGNTYSLLLDGVDGETSATLERVETYGERTVVVFVSKRAIGDIISLRTTKAEIVLETYEGYRIPRDALRVVDGKPGVFVLEGSQARFKQVEILRTEDTYYIAEADFKDTTGLYLNDNIIISTKGLYDGKVMY